MKLKFFFLIFCFFSLIFGSEFSEVYIHSNEEFAVRKSKAKLKLKVEKYLLSRMKKNFPDFDIQKLLRKDKIFIEKNIKIESTKKEDKFEVKAIFSKDDFERNLLEDFIDRKKSTISEDNPVNKINSLIFKINQSLRPFEMIPTDFEDNLKSLKYYLQNIKIFYPNSKTVLRGETVKLPTFVKFFDNPVSKFSISINNVDYKSNKDGEIFLEEKIQEDSVFAFKILPKKIFNLINEIEYENTLEKFILENIDSHSKNLKIKVSDSKNVYVESLNFPKELISFFKTKGYFFVNEMKRADLILNYTIFYDYKKSKFGAFGVVSYANLEIKDIRNFSTEKIKGFSLNSFLEARKNVTPKVNKRLIQLLEEEL